MSKGIGGHHQPYRGKTDDWLTPPWLIAELGTFDLDPCASVDQPWETAYEMWTERGLDDPWHGMVWLNPPYGPDTGDWLAALASHGSGIALIFARTETAMMFEHVWPKASGILFFRGRLHFHHPVTGERAKHNAGAPSMLVAYGYEASLRLNRIRNRGVILDLWRYP